MPSVEELDMNVTIINATRTPLLGADDGIGADRSPVEYFRLYEDVDAEGGEGSATNLIVGVWNPMNALTTLTNSSHTNQINHTSSSLMSVLMGNVTASNAPLSVSLSTPPPLPPPAVSLAASLPALTPFSTTTVRSALTAVTRAAQSATDAAVDSADAAAAINTTAAAAAVAATGITPMAAAATASDSGPMGSNMTGGHASSYGNAVDIALIDSAEAALGGDTDYDVFDGLNTIGSGLDASDATLLDKTLNLSTNATLGHLLEFEDGDIGRSYTGSTIVGRAANGVAAREADDTVRANGGSSFMLLLEDFGEYFYNYNGSGAALEAVTAAGSNASVTNFDYRINCTNFNASSMVVAGAGTGTSAISGCIESNEIDHNYWALILILFPILTLFGNILVIMSVCRERSLQTVTNYFIVSLAIADLLVAVVVMPFAVYVLVNGIWALPNFVCDFYIAMDVICSTSSIFNLVAISIDRYIAVTQPIKYAKHKNSRRVCLTILLVWAISAAIGSPIVLGLNNTPNRDPDLCVFYNTDFIVYSSLSSFYIPCIIMVFLYWNIFKALRSRARKQRAARKPHQSELTGGSVIENIAQTRRLAETALDNSRHHASRIMPDEPATNTASGSNEEEEENPASPDIDDCHVIANDKSTEFMLATVVEETGNVVAQISSQPQLVVADPNGNHDSGYAPSNVDDVLAGAVDSSPPDSPVPSGTTLKRSSVSSGRRNTNDAGSPKRDPALSVAMKPLSFVRYGVQEAMTLARNDSTLSTTSKTSSRKDKKNSQASRFTIYKVHKASKKKREKSSAKKERKATKTLAIVLGVFLFCWVPFFTCNIMDAMCAKFDQDCRPGVTAFILTTWLGYINSFVNPVIYTIFNPEFRKAFKKIMHMG